MMTAARKTICVRCLLAVVTGILFLAGCQKQTGDAVVLSKEHIDAAAPVKPVEATPAAVQGEATPPPIREMAPDEIAVDGVVMKKRDRGTPRDPRAFQNEQWLVTVRLRDGGRTFKVQAERAQFEKLQKGDTVRVNYSVGKYTGTVWRSQIEEK